MSFTILQLGKTADLAPLVQAMGGKLLVADTLEQTLEILAAQNVVQAYIESSQDLGAYFTSLNGAKLTTPTIVFGPAQPVQAAVKAIRLGAIEYLATPLEKNA